MRGEWCPSHAGAGFRAMSGVWLWRDLMNRATFDIKNVESRQFQGRLEITDHARGVQGLQRLHEGVLARYGLRPSELAAWKAVR